MPTRSKQQLKAVVPHRHASKTATSAREAPQPVAAPTPAHGVLLDDVADAHEHGERADQPREESLLGTAGSHTPRADTRAEEPFGDLDGVDAIS